MLILLGLVSCELGGFIIFVHTYGRLPETISSLPPPQLSEQCEARHLKTFFIDIFEDIFHPSMKNPSAV